jgi:hypothetical protein
MNMEKFTELFRDYVATVTSWEADMAKMAGIHAEQNSVPEQEEESIDE